MPHCSGLARDAGINFLPMWGGGVREAGVLG